MFHKINCYFKDMLLWTLHLKSLSFYFWLCHRNHQRIWKKTFKINFYFFLIVYKFKNYSQFKSITFFYYLFIFSMRKNTVIAKSINVTSILKPIAVKSHLIKKKINILFFVINFTQLFEDFSYNSVKFSQVKKVIFSG